MTPTPASCPKHGLVLAALALAISGTLAVPTVAEASGFQLKENSSKAVGRAFAGSAAAPGDVSVVVNNPAAMSTLDGVYFKADVTAINFSTKFLGEGVDVTGQPLTGNMGGDGGTTKPVPSLFLAVPVGEASHVGFAISAPFGFVTEYNRTWVGRYKAVKSDLQSIDFTFSYSYAVSDNFSIGGSLIAQQTKADLTSMVDYGTLLGVPQEMDGFARIAGDATDYGYRLGLLWKLTDRDSLGLNYRGKINHRIKGNATFHDVPPQLAALVQNGNFQNTGGTARFATPQTATLSYWHQGDQFGIGADVGYTGWSSFKELRVRYNSAQADTVEPERWKNTFYYSLGGEYRLSNTWVLRSGVSYDETPTVDATRTPRVPDGSRRMLSFGLDYIPSADLEFNFALSHLWVSNGRINNSGETGGPMGSTLLGRHKNTGNLLGGSVTFRF